MLVVIPKYTTFPSEESERPAHTLASETGGQSPKAHHKWINGIYKGLSFVHFVLSAVTGVIDTAARTFMPFAAEEWSLHLNAANEPDMYHFVTMLRQAARMNIYEQAGPWGVMPDKL